MKLVIALLTTCSVMAVVFLTNCSPIESKKDSATQDKPESCFVEAFPATVKPGASLLLRPAKSVSWDTYLSIRVENQSFDSRNTSGIKVIPKSSRDYVATAVLADGTTQICNVAVEVEGADFDAACTLVSDPTSVSANQDVNVSIQVSGTDPIISSYINEILVGHAAGGARDFNVVSTQTFIGRIESADGKSTECAATVTYERPVATGECKVEPSEEDKKKEADGNAKYAAENAAAKANKITELTAGREAYSVTTTDKLMIFSQKNVCEKITGQTSASCKALKSRNLGGVNYLLLDVAGQYYEAYGVQVDGLEVKIIKDASGKPVPIIVSPAREYVEDIPVEICECTFSSAGEVSESDMKSVPPALSQVIWYPVATNLRTASYSGGTVHSVVEKKVFLKTIKVQPPPGVAKPQCPDDWNVET